MDSLPIPGPVGVLIDWFLLIIATIIDFFNPDKNVKPEKTTAPATTDESATA